MANNIQAATRVIRRPEVEARTGLSRSTIYLRVSEGTFPAPVSLGARAVGWIESEIENWLTGQIEKTRSTSTRTRKAFAATACAHA